MTNPDNAVGTNGAFGGRTSVNALNDLASIFTDRGVISGWECVPKNALTVSLGGSGTERDVAVARDNAGNFTTVNNISQTAIDVTLEAAPTANSRIDAIVAYVANPPQGTTEAADNPGAVGLIAVTGSVAATPSAPSDSAIRSAITADGAAGSNAYYVILATITVGAGVITITGDAISAGAPAKVRTLGLPEPSGITISGSGGYTDLPDLTTFALTTLKASVGSKLTHSGNSIVVGSGVSVVRVSALALSSYSSVHKSAYSQIGIRVNGTNIANALGNVTNSNFDSPSLTPQLIPVSEGDVITLVAMRAGSYNLNSTELTVEVVA